MVLKSANKIGNIARQKRSILAYLFLLCLAILLLCMALEMGNTLNVSPPERKGKMGIRK